MIYKMPKLKDPFKEQIEKVKKKLRNKIYQQKILKNNKKDLKNLNKNIYQN